MRYIWGDTVMYGGKNSYMISVVVALDPPRSLRRRGEEDVDETEREREGEETTWGGRTGTGVFLFLARWTSIAVGIYVNGWMITKNLTSDG